MVLRLVCLFLISFCSSAWADLLPMQPLFNKSTQEFVGMVIPLGPQPPKRSHNDNGMRRTFISTLPILDIQRQAMEQLKALGLSPTIINGTVVGIKKGYKGISVVHSESIGIAHHGFCNSQEAVCLGEEITYGIRISLSPSSSGDLREKTGIFMTDPVSSIIEAGGLLIQRPTAFEVTEDLLRISGATASIDNRPPSRDWPEKDFKILTQIRMAELEMPTTPADVFTQRPSASTIPEKWQNNLTQLQNPQNLSQEKSWKTYVDQANRHAPLWKNESAQAYVQSLCNRMASAEELRPRCRIFASLLPYAFSYPGGDIFVTTGFLSAIDNEDTLVFFLAHEIAHVYSRHFSKNLEKKDFLANMMNTISLFSSIFAFQSPTAFLVKSMGSMVNQINTGQIFRGLMTNYTAENELEADELGFQMAVSLGYKPQAILSGLKSLNEMIEQNFSRKSKVPAMQLDVRYPSWQIRMTRLEKQLVSQTPAVENPSVAFVGIQKQINNAFDSFRFALRAEMEN